MRPLFKISRPVILASASPRRKDFLAGLGLEFQVLPALASEPECGASECPGDFTVRSAALKARDAFSRLDGKVKSLLPVVIGADTVVTLNEMVMGKPQDEAEALDMLRSLAGKLILCTLAAPAYLSNRLMTLTDFRKFVFTARAKCRCMISPMMF